MNRSDFGIDYESDIRDRVARNTSPSIAHNDRVYLLNQLDAQRAPDPRVDEVIEKLEQALACPNLPEADDYVREALALLRAEKGT